MSGRDGAAPRFVVHAYSFPKDEAHPQDWEDAAGYLVTGAEGWFAVADGAGSGYRVKEWARHLVDGFLDARPRTPRTTQDVLLRQRDRWPHAAPAREQSDVDWWEAMAAERLESAAAFAGVWARAPEDTDGNFHVYAIGDCCVLHVRGATLQVSFPVSAGQAFSQSPTLLYSRPEKSPDPAGWIQFCTGQLRRGDMLVLASDRLSQCLLEQSAMTGAPVWQAIRAVDRRSFQDLVRGLRDHGSLGVDDITLVRVCVI
ncbi:protein phosphatase 2C domain-containing protein [Phytohabitans rumicis]|uniref:PPM-type phosphatase domain-containing protein n=1 Tax=Phytohabitans rumicis TaxID=1076125 RepID=A0A6V8L0E5_9ACTN|nr:protein phosphatase 2C domain-containing protein [Phytohabitans rumicis]GFJ88448.1 hypothetical protein Prum_020900 [Phytohabitans rumicis]